MCERGWSGWKFECLTESEKSALEIAYLHFPRAVFMVGSFLDGGFHAQFTLPGCFTLREGQILDFAYFGYLLAIFVTDGI